MKTSFLVISVENQLIVRSDSEHSVELRIKLLLYINRKIPASLQEQRGDFPLIFDNELIHHRMISGLGVYTQPKVTPTDTY